MSIKESNRDKYPTWCTPDETNSILKTGFPYFTIWDWTVRYELGQNENEFSSIYWSENHGQNT